MMIRCTLASASASVTTVLTSNVFAWVLSATCKPNLPGVQRKMATLLVPSLRSLALTGDPCGNFLATGLVLVIIRAALYYHGCLGRATNQGPLLTVAKNLLNASQVLLPEHLRISLLVALHAGVVQALGSNRLTVYSINQIDVPR